MSPLPVATRALNFGLYVFRVVVIDPSFANDSTETPSLFGGLKSGSTIGVSANQFRQAVVKWVWGK